MTIKASVIFSTLILLSNTTFAKNMGCDGFLYANSSPIFDSMTPEQVTLKTLLKQGKLFDINTYAKSNPLTGTRARLSGVIKAYMSSLPPLYSAAIQWYVGGPSYIKIYAQELRNNRLSNLNPEDPKLSSFERKFLEVRNTIRSIFETKSMVAKQGTILFKGLYQRNSEPFMIPEKGSLWSPQQIVSLTTSPNTAWDFASSKIDPRLVPEYTPIILVVEMAEDIPLVPGGTSYADFLTPENITFEVTGIYSSTADSIFFNHGVDSNIVHLRAYIN